MSRVYGPDYVDEFVAQVDNPANPNNQPMYMLQDANYNVVAILNTPAQGQPVQVLAQYTYEPYGGRAVAEEPGLTTGTENIVGHQGLFFYRLNTGASPLSPSTVGLYYNRNRWYSPQLGNFLQADPRGTSLVTVANPAPRLAGSACGGLTASGWTLCRSICSGDRKPMPLDPEEHYGDGMNTYACSRSNPVASTDAAGLMSAGELVGASLGDAWINANIKQREAKNAAVALALAGRIIALVFAYEFLLDIATRRIDIVVRADPTYNNRQCKNLQYWCLWAGGRDCFTPWRYCLNNGKWPPYNQLPPQADPNSPPPGY